MILMNDGIAELIDSIDKEKIERARRMPLGEKFLAGAELFEQACEVARCGIASRYPEWSDKQVTNELRRRLDLGRNSPWLRK